MPRAAHPWSRLLLASAALLLAVLPARAGAAPQRFAARSMPETAPVIPGAAATPAAPAAAPAPAPSAAATPEEAAKVAALRAKEVWTADCGRVGTLAGSGMGFCVVNAN